MFAREEGTFGTDGTLLAFWAGTFAYHLAMLFQQQIGAGAGVEGGGYLRLDRVLGLAVGHHIVFALSAQQNSYEHVGAVGWDGCDRCNVGEEKNPVCTGTGDVGKFSEFSSCLIERPGEGSEKITAEMVFYAHGDLFEAQGA